MKSEMMCLPALQGLLGACCDCGSEDRPVYHVVMLAMKSPEPGQGCWGCMTCDLPQAGAMAVLCVQCAKTFNGRPLNVVLGSPDLNRRMPFTDLREAFEHDRTKHTGSNIELIFGGHAPKNVPKEIGELVEAITDDVKKFIDLEIKRERHSRN